MQTVRRMRTLAALLAAICTLGLAACNTMRGMGQDIEAGGDKLENAAEKAKN